MTSSHVGNMYHVHILIYEYRCIKRYIQAPSRYKFTSLLVMQEHAILPHGDTTFVRATS